MLAFLSKENALVTKRNFAILMLLFAILVLEIVILAPGELGSSPEDDRAAARAESGEAAKSPVEGQTGQVMQDVHLVEAKPGGKEWELWAKKAVRPSEDASWTIEQVEIKFFGENEVVYTCLLYTSPSPRDS